MTEAQTIKQHYKTYLALQADSRPIIAQEIYVKTLGIDTEGRTGAETLEEVKALLRGMIAARTD